MMRSFWRATGGQEVVEYALLSAGVIIPLTFGIIFVSEMLWIWHSVNEFTRDGARYAATHCWQASGANVQDYMKSHVPPMIDMDQFQNGAAVVTVQFYQRNAQSGELEEFACDLGECTTACVPDTVTVAVTNYEFRRFVSFLGLPAVAMPDFRTTMAVQGAGCDETGVCTP